MRNYLVLIVAAVICVTLVVTLSLFKNENVATMKADKEGSRKEISLGVIPTLSVTGDCTDLIHNYVSENYYPDEDYSGSAYARAEISTSRIYGEGCSGDPYKEFARVRVKCEGRGELTKIYVQRASQDATWDDMNFDCGRYGCSNRDEDYPEGTHTINLRNSEGDLRSVFIICYDYDENGGYWSSAWKGYGYYGDREVYESHTTKKCSNNDVYWYNSLGDREDRYRECGSDSCDNWGDNYCEGSEVKQDRTCYKRGCSNAACYKTRKEETRTVETCDVCRQGQCISPGGESIFDFIGNIFGG